MVDDSPMELETVAKVKPKHAEFVLAITAATTATATDAADIESTEHG
jgi:hypothetical protein